MGRAKKIKKTGKSEKDYELPLDAISIFNSLVRVEREMIADGSYHEEKDDPLVRVLGPEHGGRSRTVSDVIGATKVHGGLYKNGRESVIQDSGVDVNCDRDSEPGVDMSPTFHESSCGPGVQLTDYPPIMRMTPCELLLSDACGNLVTVANGRAWPTSSQVLHNNTIMEGCVKVQVDDIVDEHSSLPVFDVTKTDEINVVGDILFTFVQWPRNALKLANQETPRKSTSAPTTTSRHGSPSYRSVSPKIHFNDFSTTSCYRPQLEVFDTFPQIQLQEDMMQPEDVQGGFMNLLLNANKIQPVSQNLFELHALEPEPNPVLNLTPESEFVNHEPEFVDPDVAPALDKIKKRPKRIRKIAKRLSKHVGTDYAIRVVSPDGMYPEPIVEDIPYSELLQIFLNGWLDYSVLHWFAMHSFESPNSHCAFFNPKLINGSTCLANRPGVGEHMHNICMFHSKKTFFIAPYVAGKHWSLLIFCPSFKCGFIIDSTRGGKNKNNYLLVSIYEEVFKTRLIWHMVQCKQQQSTWECGYIVMKHMQEFVQDIQHDLVNRLWKEEGLFLDSEIEDLVVRSMKEFINKVFGDVKRNLVVV